MCEICGKVPHDPRCPNAVPQPIPSCPVCGAEAEEFYVDKQGRVAGCDRCLHPRPWWEMEAET